jgi:inosine-uridine nucleoside N-ribohydrolase
LDKDRLPLVWDMETGDPDDFLTLLLLLDHPRVDLKAVTVTPGSAAQVGVVRRGMELLGRDIPVGARELTCPQNCVSRWHYEAFGDIPPSMDAEPAAQLLLETVDKNTTLLTGGPNQNLGTALALAERTGIDWRIGTWIAQGGFAGEGVVPRERQLPKFAGRTTCPTYNLNGAPADAQRGLSYGGIGLRRFVSKNVCHGVIYDQTMHERFAPARHRRQSLELIWTAMNRYLLRRPTGKAFHDPLAACCAIDASIGIWAEVELYFEKSGPHGAWGSRRSPGTGTWIITDHDHERFVDTMLEA